MAYKMARSGKPIADANTQPYRPEGAFVGNILLRNEWDALYYNLVTSITGNLYFEGNDDITLPNLVSVSGALRGSASGALETFSAPALVSVGSLFLDGTLMPRLASVALPVLATISSSLQVYVCRAFTSTSLTMPALTMVGAGNGGAVEFLQNRTVGVNGFTNAAAHALVAQLAGPPAHDPVTNVLISDNDP